MNRRPRLTDLFCCEGGAAAGYTAAGFDVHGWDIVTTDPDLTAAVRSRRIKDMRARYTAAGGVSFTVGDATRVREILDHDDPDAVHASPPCKDHTDLASQSGGDGTGWMLPHTIRELRAWGEATGRPWVVENVVSPSTKSHMNGAVMLCGSMFGLRIPGTSFRSRGVVTRVPRWRYLQRHRLFLSNVPMLTPPDQCSGLDIVGVYGTGGGGQMTRGYKATPAEAREVMGMPWASRNGCAQAIPPAYAQWLGEYLMAAHTARVAS